MYKKTDPVKLVIISKAILLFESLQGCDFYNIITLANIARREALTMTQVNVLEAKNELSRLIRLLETGQEEMIVIARNGAPVVQMMLYPKKERRSVIGAAKGKFNCPSDPFQYDDEVSELFGV